MCVYVIYVEYLGASGEILISKFSFQAILMHNPVAFLSFRSSASVENQSLLHAHKSTSLGAVNLSVLPSGLPVTSLRSSVSSQPSWVLPVSQAKEVPLFLAHLCLSCRSENKSNKKCHNRFAYQV